VKVSASNNHLDSTSVLLGLGEKMRIEIISDKISNKLLRQLAEDTYTDMVKAVVDLKKVIIAIGGELHADAEAILLEQGSEQENLWGINLYPDKLESDRIQYTSLINIRPKQGNTAMEISNPGLRKQIKQLVDQRVEWDNS